jgi:hypothetical protein
MIKLFSSLFHVTYLLGMAAVTIVKSNKNPAPTPEEIEREKQERLKMMRCPYWSKHYSLKCAVNPSISCLECHQK